MTNDDFCSYEIAQALKKVGFDLTCDRYWYQKFADSDNMTLGQASADDFNNDDWYVPHCSAPSLAQAQKWLIGKGYYINVQLLSRKIWSYVIENEYGDEIHSVLQTWECYESALSAGVEAALKLLTNKN